MATAPPGIWAPRPVHKARNSQYQQYQQQQQRVVTAGRQQGSSNAASSRGRAHRATQQVYRGNQAKARPPTDRDDSRQRTVGHYLLGKALGEGSFGKVRLGTHILTGEKVAVKVLEKARLVESADVQRVAREIKILKRNRHKNIIQLFEVLDTPNAIYLIMENADAGEMFNHIVQRKRLDEASASGFFAQIIDGAEYLHAMEVTHRDLKPENLLLQSSAARGLLVKIVDFGLSNTHDGGALLGTACGSPCYAAPEMIAGKKYWGPKADIWSMGVILYASVAGYLPFEDQNTSVLYKKIMAGDYACPNWLSVDCVDLISKILNTNPENRVTIPQIRGHVWYQQHQQNFKHADPTKPIIVPVEEAVTTEEEETSEPVVFDEEILKQIEQMGIAPSTVTAALTARAHNNLTTTYHLLKNRRLRIDESAKAPPPKTVSPLDQRHYLNKAIASPRGTTNPAPRPSTANQPAVVVPKLELGGTALKLPKDSPTKKTESARPSSSSALARRPQPYVLSSVTAREDAPATLNPISAPVRGAEGGPPRQPPRSSSSRRPLFQNNNPGAALIAQQTGVVRPPSASAKMGRTSSRAVVKQPLLVEATAQLKPVVQPSRPASRSNPRSQQPPANPQRLLNQPSPLVVGLT